MTYEEYKRQRLAQNNTQSNVSNTTKINTAPVNRYEEYKKQRLAQPKTFNTQEEALAYAKQNNMKIAGNNNIVPTTNYVQPKKFVNIPQKSEETSSKTSFWERIKNAGLTNEQAKYADELIDNNSLLSKGYELSKNVGNTAKASAKTLGANALDSTVDVLQYAKNAFKSEMKGEEREDLELAIKLQNGFRGTKNQLTDEQANEFINYVKNKYNVSDFQNELNNINEWTYKENKLESATNELVSKVNEGNTELGKIGQRVANAFGTVGRMAPTIATNIVAPGLSYLPMYMSSAQASQDEALRNGASYNDAVANGILSGALEVGTEAIGGERIAKLTGIPTLASKLGIRTGIIGDIVSEEIEEMISTTVQPFIDRITYNPNAPMATKEDYWNTFIDTALSTVLLMGVGEGINTVTEYRDKAISKVNESNMSVEQKQQSISEIEKGANELIDKVKNNAKNSTNINENTPNIEQISQNNVQNVSDLEKSQQMSISDKQNRQATVTDEIQTFVENRNKISPGLSVEMDSTLNTDGIIEKRADGTRTMKINPNSSRAYEFVAVHEMLHDLEGAKEQYQDLSSFVKKRAMTHEDFETAKSNLTEQYTKYYQENGLDMSNLNMENETVNDMVARALGNQDFLNELAGNKPNVFMRMYNWIKNVLFDSNNTGKTFSERRTQNKYLQELKSKFEIAYNTAYKGSTNEQYSLKGRDKNGYPIYESDLMQEITNKEKIKHLEKQMEVLKGKPLFFNINGQKIKAYFDDYGVQKTTYGTVKGDKAETRKGFQTKEMLATDLYTIINNSKFIGEADEISNITNTLPKNKAHQDVRKWYTFENKINYKGEIYTVLTTVRKKDDGNYGYSVKFYENKKNNSVQAYSLENFRDNTHSSYVNSIPSNNNVVNSQYMQDSSNNTQGLDKSSSFSLGENTVTVDNKGRKLSKGQQEFFKNVSSEIKDEKGNLETLYHQTDNDFMVFDITKRTHSQGDYLMPDGVFLKNNNNNIGIGNNSKQMELYAKIEKPLVVESRQQLENILNEKKEYAELINSIRNIDIEFQQKYEKAEKQLDDAYLKEWNARKNGENTTELEKQTEELSLALDKILDDWKKAYGVRSAKARSMVTQILKEQGYDGLIVKQDEGSFGRSIKTYIVFNPNQIKNVDNLNPTDNPDIRYSQSNDKWQSYLDKNWNLMPNSKKTFGFPTNEQLQVMDNKKISEGADVLNLKEKKIKSLEDIANMTENDARMENGVNYKHKKDKNTPYQRKFFENVETSKIINQKVKDTIEMTTYERQANEQTLEKAKNSLDEQGDKIIKQWERKTKNFTAEDVAIGAILIERYQQQGDNESAVNVVQKLADMGTEAGRAVQMFSIFQRLTPEAMLIYQQRKLNDVFKEISQRKTGEWVEANRDKFQLTSEDGKFITEQVEKAQQATSERQKQIELAKIEARINNKLPPDRGQTIKAIRRISMLFNPKTQVRNIVGNTLIMPINDVADIIGTQIDKAIAKRTGVRTTNNPIFKEKGKGFKKGITESIQDYKMGIRTEPSGSKYEFNFGGKSFNENTSSKALNVINNKLNGIENLLGAVMSGGDRPFYEAAFNNSLQGQMKANNVTTPTTEMIDIAVNEALSRTWNDSNSYTEAVLGIRRQMNKLNIGGFGLGDLIIPFAKTPANLTKAMVEYSPLGTIEAIINYSDMKKAISRGEMTAQQQKNFVNSTSKAITGSILYLIAGALAQSGAVTGSADDDKDVRNFEQNVLGIQPYSIKIGDKTFTYSWANPLNAPLAIMADTYKMGKEKAGLFDILTNGFKVAGEVVVDNSFLQGIKELFEADSISEGVVNAIVDMPAQFVPTFLSQFATLGDKTKRQTFEYGDKLKSTINQIKAKIPGAKNTLAPTVNTFGEEVENYGGDNSAFNVFLNPANISKANATDTQKELYALYEATKDKTIFPMQAPYYLSDDGEKVNLSSNERSEYQKRSGEYVSKELHALFDSEFYKTLESEDKVEVVNKIVKDANTHAKSKWITTKATKELKKIQEELKDVPMVDYYNAWLAQKDAEGKKNAKKAINSAVDDDLTTYQKKALYRIFNVN